MPYNERMYIKEQLERLRRRLDERSDDISVMSILEKLEEACEMLSLSSE